MTRKKQALTRVHRVPMAATTPTPWQIRCRVCIGHGFEFDAEIAELAGSMSIVRPTSWWFASATDALAWALQHLATHREATA